METENLTFGQKAVGLAFNPGGNPEVDTVKRQFAAIIDTLDELRRTAGAANRGEMGRLASIAITEAQTAQMWAVKALTWKD